MMILLFSELLSATGGLWNVYATQISKEQPENNFELSGALRTFLMNPPIKAAHAQD